MQNVIKMVLQREIEPVSSKALFASKLGKLEASMSKSMLPIQSNGLHTKHGQLSRFACVI